MAGKAFSVDIDVSRIKGLEGRLSGLSGEDFGRMAMQVVNRVADETYDLSVRRLLNGINLTEEYVQERIIVEKAKNPDNVKATITGLAHKKYMTMLARYDGRQQIRDVNWKNEQIQAMGKRFGRWPGWVQRKGDVKRNIPANYKSAGTTAEVRRGNVTPFKHTFFMPLRNGNGMGIFERTGDGKKDYRHLYGPSVYQLFAFTASNIIDEVADNLETQLADEAERLLQRALS